MTGLPEIVTIWYPGYWLSGAVKLANSALLAQATEQERLDRELQRVNRELQEQLFDSATQAPRIVAQRGFSQRTRDEFKTVTTEGDTATARALRQHERVIVEDVWQDRPIGRSWRSQSGRAIAPFRRHRSSVGMARSIYFR